MRSTSIDADAGCKSSRSVAGALSRAAQLVSREFKILGQYTPVFNYEGKSCLVLRKEWDSYVEECVSRVKPRSKSYHRLVLMLKSGKRLFDGDCDKCDAPQKKAEKEKWKTKMSVGQTVGSPEDRAAWLSELRRHVRVLIGGWGKNLAESRKGDLYVPDQQGCFERTSILGGTLAAMPDRSLPFNHVRLGTAKAKGKIRVVTMQNAYVKQVLRPVHTALYNHISSFNWLVRGEVGEKDFLAVKNDRKKGESIISGDYASATDNIHVDVVETIISVIAEESLLSDEEREVLIGSFKCVTVVNKDGSLTPVMRGSMMGNLVSFPLLCLLNKACFEMSRPNHNCSKGCRLQRHCHRVGRFNGDDCIFCGDQKFFQRWREITARFGLVVQEEKTGVSDRYGELNSQCFDYFKGAFIPKSFFSFLRPNRTTGGDLLGEIIQGTKHMRKSTQLWLINHVCRYEIAIRGVVAASVPDNLASRLLKRRWIRKIISSPPPPFPSTGVDRSIPVQVGPLPREDYLSIVDEIDREVTRAHVNYWRGRQVLEVSCPIWRNGHGKTEKDKRLFQWFGNETSSWQKCLKCSVPVVGTTYCSCSGKVFLHSTPYDSPVTPLRTRLGDRKNRHAQFDTSPPPPSHIRYRREISWSFTYLKSTWFLLNKFFGSDFLMDPRKIGDWSPYDHKCLGLKHDIVAYTPPVDYPPPSSLTRVPLLTLGQHARRVYGLPSTSTLILEESRKQARYGMRISSSVKSGFEKRRVGLYRGIVNLDLVDPGVLYPKKQHSQTFLDVCG